VTLAAKNNSLVKEIEITMSVQLVDNLVVRVAILIKRLYVSFFRRLRVIANKTGLIDILDAHKNNRILLWLRSLFAIYDVEDMLRLGIPWWTFQAIDLVECFLRYVPQARVFEYGAGASTLWLANRAGSVYFVEHDAVYKEIIDQYVASLKNVTGFLEIPIAKDSPNPFTSHKLEFQGLSFQNYTKRIEAVEGLFDLIIVDGRCRMKCLEYALSHLSETGCIVFDNSNRPFYRNTLQRLSYPTIETRGLTPCLPYSNQTTLIFKTTAMRDKLLRLSGIQ
jgi:hypothetical protein